jgi:hypothetical protein
VESEVLRKICGRIGFYQSFIVFSLIAPIAVLSACARCIVNAAHAVLLGVTVLTSITARAECLEREFGLVDGKQQAFFCHKAPRIMAIPRGVEPPLSGRQPDIIAVRSRDRKIYPITTLSLHSQIPTTLLGRAA